MLENWTEPFKDQRLIEWSRTLRELNARGMEILEFDPTIKASNHWALLVNSAGPDNIYDDSKVDYYKHELNLKLASGFKDLANEDSEFWKEYFAEFIFYGFCIPTNDIQNVTANLIRSQLYFQELLLNFFPYQRFFTSLSLHNKLHNNNEYFNAYALWFYVSSYADFLIQLKQNSNQDYKLYGYWYTHLLDQDNFYSKLPSEQLTILLLIKCEAIVANIDTPWENQRSYPLATTAIDNFFDQYESTISSLLDGTAEWPNTKNTNSDFQNMITDLNTILESDYDILLIQELLDNKSNLKLVNQLPISMQLKYGPQSIYNVSGVIKEKLFSTEKRSTGIYKRQDTIMPSFQAQDNSFPKNVQQWYDLTEAESDKILSIIKSESPTQKNIIKQRCLSNFTKLMNQISAPILIWKPSELNAYPQWNFFEYGEENLRKLYLAKKRLKSEEKFLLEKHLITISELQSLNDLIYYKSQNEDLFSFQEYHQKWVYALQRVQVQFTQKQKFLQSRMKEFGISESKLNDDIKKIWLTEMLKVEDEVKPYITYVKKAFQAALPQRKRIYFSEYRHVNDGLEFDPDTLFNHEKWMRADVMKVMESRTEIGEAIQVNTFCLDYSGSMRHDRMRNLFKMLYLLVLGLEDRKSFDAFHFFGNIFIPGVDFSSAYTNRKVLFKILRKISSLQMGEVQYSGSGGTNISEGISKSHNKMKKFVADYRQKHPTANIVTSIFVITDGEPSLGITETEALHDFIEDKREDSDTAIKGIFIKSKEDRIIDNMRDIFGEKHFIETDDFQEAVNSFVQFMTETYKEQRKKYKWTQKKRKLGLRE